MGYSDSETESFTVYEKQTRQLYGQLLKKPEVCAFTWAVQQETHPTGLIKNDDVEHKQNSNSSSAFYLLSYQTKKKNETKVPGPRDIFWSAKASAASGSCWVTRTGVMSWESPMASSVRRWGAEIGEGVG